MNDLSHLTAVSTGLGMALTLTLLHFLWLGTVIALMTRGMDGLLRRKSAQARYAVNVAGLVAMGMCLPVTFALVYLPAEPAAAAAMPTSGDPAVVSAPRITDNPAAPAISNPMAPEPSAVRKESVASERETRQLNRAALLELLS